MQNGFLSPKDIALAVGQDDKLVRKFLRSAAPNRPGKGGRWLLPASELDVICERFAEWHKGRAVVFSFLAEEAEAEEGEEI